MSSAFAPTPDIHTGPGDAFTLMCIAAGLVVASISQLAGCRLEAETDSAYVY
jgi:hypothetical protein